MKKYFCLIALLFMMGFILLPSVHLPGSNASAGIADSTKPTRQSATGQFAPATAIFTVNSTGDADDFMPGDGVCSTTSSSECTLRAAIEESNALIGADIINFNIPGGGPQTIAPLNPLPAITESVIIDGTSQPGFAGSPIIELKGANLNVQTSNSTIRGLAINFVDGDAVILSGNNNSVIGNFIGTDLSGVTGPGNASSGVAIFGSGNVIGGTLATERNVIALNDTGVSVSSGTGNLIRGNSIFDNTLLGINLSDDNVTPNDNCDADTGANNLQNFPVLTSATSNGSSITIQGSINSTPGTPLTIDFYANDACDSSGFGEGRTYIGSTSVTTNLSCTANFNSTFAVAVPAGQFITATATTDSNDTSEFSQCITVASVTCTASCPEGIVRSNDPNQCGAVVTFNGPVTSGACGPVTCTPPSGSFFPVGITQVTCDVDDGPTCSFLITINDTQPPTVSCPQGFSVPADAGKPTKVVDYPLPTATDNCPDGVNIFCRPASGSSFPVGTTVVTCTVSDAAGNFVVCQFPVSVLDITPPTIACPSNQTVTLGSANNCTATVNFPAPTFTGPAGATVTCVPPSGSTFPVGTTTVNCSVTTQAALIARCSFTVTVNNPAQLVVTLQNAALEFGPVTARRKKFKNPPSATFEIQNVGCSAVSLSFRPRRTGSDVDSGRITDTDDSDLFIVNAVNSDGSERPVSCDSECSVRINVGQRQLFRVRFNPVIPQYAGKTTGLAARDVLPDTVTSRLDITPNLFINLIGRVSTPVQATNPDNVRKSPTVSFTRNGNEYLARFGFHDANLNVSRARYEFLNASGQTIGDPIEVDLTEQIRALNPVKGQSLIVEQRFTNANDNPDATAIRVTIIDGEGNSVVSSSVKRTLSAASPAGAQSSRADVLRPPDVSINNLTPRRKRQ